MMSHHVVSPRTYLIVFAALMVLMVLTVAVTQLEQLQHGLIANVVALSIAVAKAVLIIMFFMHVKYSSHLTKLFAVAGFVWLLILFAFSLSDYKTRQWQPTRHNYPVQQAEQ